MSARPFATRYVYTSRREIVRTSARPTWSETLEAFFVDGQKWHGPYAGWGRRLTGWHLGTRLEPTRNPELADMVR